MSDTIEPTWGEDVLVAEWLDDRYEPPELLSTHLERVAADPAVTVNRPGFDAAAV